MNRGKPRTRARLAREEARRALGAVARRLEVDILPGEASPAMERVLEHAARICDRRPPPELPALIFATEDEAGEIELITRAIGPALATLERIGSPNLEPLLAADAARQMVGADSVIMVSSRRTGEGLIAVFRAVMGKCADPAINVWSAERGLA